jgi:hypothetical protein
MLKMGKTITRWTMAITLGLAAIAPAAFAQDQPPAANVNISDSITTGGGVLPLSRWIPIFRIELGHQAQDMSAYRALTQLNFFIKNDGEDRAYDKTITSGDLFTDQIRDFAIFREANFRGLNSFTTVLDGEDFQSNSFVGPILTWTPNDTILDQSAPGDLSFSLSLPPLANCSNDPSQNENVVHNLSGPGNGQADSYIVAFRSTDLWTDGQTLAYEVTFAQMLDCDGNFFTNDMGDPIDTYNPNFYNGDPLDPGSAYASSFSVLDITGSIDPVRNNEVTQAYNWPQHMYTPLAEHRRPRFDVPGNFVDFVTGEWVEMRRLFALDSWTALIGISAHSVTAVETVYDGFEDFYLNLPIGDPQPGNIMEVNVIMTDVGADPLGPPGNGGFNPRTMLETSTSEIYAAGTIPAGFATGPDATFNGIWVVADTNGNAVYDPPQPTTGGVSITDRALFPFNSRYAIDSFFDNGTPPDNVLEGLPEWEYIPFPPGGGDPWWKIRLRFNNGARRNTADPNDDPPTGELEIVPDDLPDLFTADVFDYFVVVRPDAGFFDSQNLPGDGVGMTFGSDFRAFIEPQRLNPNTGQLDGGIFIDTQEPDRGFYIDGIPFFPPWQSDTDFTAGEPWWDQRSMNKSIARVNRSGVEIHDLVITYESNNRFAQDTFIDFRNGSTNSPGFFFTSLWSSWFDPLGLISNQFSLLPFGHHPGVARWRISEIADDDNQVDVMHFPYETASFFNPTFDGTGPFAPRSNFFPFPPAQPPLPQYATWPGSGIAGFLDPDKTPMEEQWPAVARSARFNRQRINPGSAATAMIGANFASVDDPVTNAVNGVFLGQMTVALWGPGFNPHVSLQPVDPSGTGGLSGVALYEDTSLDGVFGADLRLGPGVTVPEATDVDDPVALQSASFRPNPEPIDLDGDGLADDMSGDGVYTPGIDDAWVIRLAPSTPWPLPVNDIANGNVGNIPAPVPAPGAERTASEQAIPRASGQDYWTETPTTAAVADPDPAPKAIGPQGNSGDDLFVVVRTSDNIPRGQLFRVVVPATLPSRPVFDRLAGIELTPQTPVDPSAYEKAHPEEGPPERYYGVGRFGVDMIEANIGVRLDAAIAPGDIFADSGDVPVMKIDLSTNRGDITGVADSSSTSGVLGVGAPGSFVVPGVTWTAGSFTNFFLIDSSYESFEITGNNSNTLFLRTSGNVLDAPLNGQWIIARSPSFFEQLVVEFYDEGNDGGFNLLEDLLPLQIDPTLSGVKLYRDNDFNPSNVNGEYDPFDIPVQLDYAPYQIGQPGEPQYQLMLDFSSPGTDDIGPGGVAATLASQFPHNRQWVQDSFGISTDDPNFGADFFLVINTSDRIQIGDDFRVGVVSWGANTDTLPDPNTFPPPPISVVGEFDVFSEFPWGSRALGFITFSYSGSTLYKAYPDPDISGFSWVRSTTSKAEQTSTITTVQRVVQPDDLVITDATPVLLTKITAASGETLSIEGVNFGISPVVMLDALTLAVTASTAEAITAIIPGGTIIDDDNDGLVTLRVTDPATAKTDTYSDFTIINADPATTPTITTVTPDSGNSTVFPVTIIGTNFDNPTVIFGSTVLPVASFTTTTIVVNFPIGGLPTTGPLDVTVVNITGLFAIASDAFTYINAPGGGGGGGGFGPGGGLPTKGCFIATAAFDGAQTRELTALREFRDDVLLKSAFGAALVDAYYTMSPPVADTVSERPWLATGVRAMLTPVARTVEQPAWLGLPLGMLAAGMIAGRARRRSKTLSR